MAKKLFGTYYPPFSFLLEIEAALDEAEREALDPNTKYYTQEELDLKIRKILNDK